MSVQDEYNKEQERTENFIRKFGKVTDDVVASIDRQVLASLGTLQNDEEKILQYELLFVAILTKAGYFKAVDSLVDTYFDTMYKPTLTAFKQGGLATKYTKKDVIKIQVLKQLEKTFFLRMAYDVGLAVKKELYNYAIADASIDSMSIGISKTLKSNNLARYSQTYARTAVQNFQQGIINLRATDVEGGWIYVGVQDEVTRDYCNDVLSASRYYNDSEKSHIENNPDRQYNCRHRLYKVSKEYAEANGYD